MITAAAPTGGPLQDMPPRKTAIPIIILLGLMIVPVCWAQSDDKKPSLKLKGIALKSLDVTSLVAETVISIEIENPGLPFTIKDASYRIKLNDQDAAEGKRDDEIKVPAESSAIVELPLTVHLGVLPGVTWRTIADGLNLKYDLETEFNVPLLVLAKSKVRTSFSGSLPIGDRALQLPGKLKETLFGKPDRR